LLIFRAGSPEKSFAKIATPRFFQFIKGEFFYNLMVLLEVTGKQAIRSLSEKLGVRVLTSHNIPKRS
jgi:hypothetical protein